MGRRVPSTTAIVRRDGERFPVGATARGGS